MMSFSPAACASFIQAHWKGASDILCSGVCTDSRTLQKGDLFVALKGERFNGHAFVLEALKQGAAAVLISEAIEGLPDNAPVLSVQETGFAFGQLAAWWKNQFTVECIALTGSNGKTTVKEMLATVLRAEKGEAAVLATEGNLNNEIGVPHMLLKLRAQHRYAIIEMGMNHAGEIAQLSRWTQPDIVLINNAHRAHMGHFQSVEDIAQAKGEIVLGLKPEGCAVFPIESPFFDQWANGASPHTVHSFGLEGGELHAEHIQHTAEGSTFSLVETGQPRVSVKLAVPGLHMVHNALAVARVARLLNLPLERIATQLERFQGVKGRLRFLKTAAGHTLIDDTYNANPDSVRAAIAVLSRLPAPRILVLGDIGELGDFAPALHAELGTYARQMGIDHLFCLGEQTQATHQAFGAGSHHFLPSDRTGLVNTLKTLSFQSCLVKGSRFMQMEKVVADLMES